MRCETCPAEIDGDDLVCVGEFFVCPACAERMRKADGDVN